MFNASRCDDKRRRLFRKYETQRLLLQSIFLNMNLPKDVRFAAQKKLAQLPRNSSLVRVQNRCILSGRAHGVYKKFKISRIQFRNLALQGALPGILKASW